MAEKKAATPADAPSDASPPAPAGPSTEDMELLVLSVLDDESLYGYAVAKRIAARSEGSFRVSPGVLYPLLAQFEKQGLIAGRWEEVRSARADADTPGRRRKWYDLTPKGRRRLQQRIQAHRAYTRIIESFITPHMTRNGDNA